MDGFKHGKSVGPRIDPYVGQEGPRMERLFCILLLGAYLLLRRVIPALLLVFLSICASNAVKEKKPHIIIILADDLGWNDVSFHGSAQIPTPNIDALAYGGLILQQHYVPALCTPSRSSLMTGRYPIHTGMQHIVILEPEPWGLPLNERLLPEHLRDAGYATHAVGKWHLGFFKREYTPTYRGFQSHFGYWNGLQDYFDHSVHATWVPMHGFDMRRNMSLAWDTKGKYSTSLFTDEAVRLIHEHPEEKPMFLYLAHLAPHTGNQNEPFQALDEDVALFSHIDDPERRLYAAMVHRLDQSVGEVMQALRTKNMLENSIVLFMSDNGAPTFGIHSNRGSNHPLRGIKETPWEGGVRGVAALWSPFIEKPGRIVDTMMHMTDWLPTLATAVGLNSSSLHGPNGEHLDGLDQWATLTKAPVSGTRSPTMPGPRDSVVNNIDDVDHYASLRQGNFKYVAGQLHDGLADKWYGEKGDDEGVPEYDVNSVLRSKAGAAIAGVTARLQSRKGNKVPWVRPLTASSVNRLRRQATVSCGDVEPVECRPQEAPCLFDVTRDPCELRNIAAEQPEALHDLERLLIRYRSTMVAPRNVPTDPLADPALWNSTWINWKDDDLTVSSEDAEDALSEILAPIMAVAATAAILFAAVAARARISNAISPAPDKATSAFTISSPALEKQDDVETRKPGGAKATANNSGSGVTVGLESESKSL